MEICYPVLCYYPSQAGGPANTLYWLNREMDRIGLKPYVISTKYGLPLHFDEKNIDFKREKIKVVFLKNKFTAFFSPSILLSLRKVQVVHFSSIFFPPTLPLIFWSLLTKKKILISPRGELYEQAMCRHRFIKLRYISLLKLFQKKFNFHATNDFEKRLIDSFFPRSKYCFVLPNYIKLPERLYLPRKKQLLFLGRINPIKNIHLIIQSFSEIPIQIRNDFKIVIGGAAILEYEGKYLYLIQELVNKLQLSDIVDFRGSVTGKEKEILLAESHCTILPSKSENFGNVILESLSQATPVIVSNMAPWSDIEPFGAGFCVDPNLQSVKNAITKILVINDDEYMDLSLNAYLLANRYDIEKNIFKWKRHYGEL